MHSKLTSSALFLLSPLASLASPFQTSDGSVAVDEPTKSIRAIVERAAPSEYPLRPGPFEKEWKYANWDPEDATQKAQLEKIHSAFYETFYSMAADALLKFRDDDQTMIQR